jgi:hypothetical protein
MAAAIPALFQRLPMTLIEILRDLIAAKTGGSAIPTAPTKSDEPAAARTLEERQAARAELDRLEADGLRKCLALRRELESATEARVEAQRAADEAREVERRAQTARDVFDWGVQIRASKIRAELARGASPIIDAAVAELDRQWQAERTASRHIGAIHAPLSEAQVSDNAAADANLTGLRTAQQECESLKYEALSETELAAALERIIRGIPPRYPQHEPVAIDLKTNGSTRPRVAHSARAVAA